MWRSPESANFAFLADYDAQLARLGALAERYFRDDPNTCLIKLRQFGELLAQQLAARTGVFAAAEEFQVDLLRRLKVDRLMPAEVADLFHQLRLVGNQAAHGQAGDHRAALTTPEDGPPVGRLVSPRLRPGPGVFPRPLRATAGSGSGHGLAPRRAVQVNSLKHDDPSLVEPIAAASD